MTQGRESTIFDHGPTYQIAMSGRPSDYLLVQRVGRALEIREPNGALYVTIQCPAVAAGYDPEELGETRDDEIRGMFH